MAETPKVSEAKTDTYKERPYKEAAASPKDIAKAEARPEKDQIEDYHKKNPTLKNSAAVEKAISEQQD